MCKDFTTAKKSGAKAHAVQTLARDSGEHWKSRSVWSAADSSPLLVRQVESVRCAKTLRQPKKAVLKHTQSKRWLEIRESIGSREAFGVRPIHRRFWFGRSSRFDVQRLYDSQKKRC